MNRKTFFWVSIFTLFFWGILGLLAMYYATDIHIKRFIFTKYTKQILTGLLYGFTTGYAVVQGLKMPYFNEVNTYFSELFKKMEFNWFDIVFASLCAGIGEELLFRGAIQYFLGVPLTAIIFVAIHGYLNPKKMRLTVYGLLLVVITMGFGLLANRLGLLSAIMAHASYDIVMFAYLLSYKNKANVSLDTY